MLNSSNKGIQKVKEVLVFDSSTFINEVGLTTNSASALRYYLYYRKIQLAVPQVVVVECERNLNRIALGKVKHVHEELRWLSMFCGSVSGWTSPDEVDIAARSRTLARGEAFNAVVLEESSELQQRAKERSKVEQPPSHRKDSERDCRIWEQCLELLREHNVIFVSNDKDFCGNKQTKQLHPQLKAEADESGGSLTFHYGMRSLLSDLRRDEIPQPSAKQVFTFIYKSNTAKVGGFEEISGCRPTSSGTVEQEMFTTNQVDIVEVRLKMKDRWMSDETDVTFEFSLAGSYKYHLSDSELCDLSLSNIGLYKIHPDGKRHAVKGSTSYMSGHATSGIDPIQPDPVALVPVEELN